MSDTERLEQIRARAHERCIGYGPSIRDAFEDRAWLLDQLAVARSQVAEWQEAAALDANLQRHLDTAVNQLATSESSRTGLVKQLNANTEQLIASAKALAASRASEARLRLALQSAYPYMQFASMNLLNDPEGFKEVAQAINKAHTALAAGGPQ